MGPVWQKPIQRTVRTAHLIVLMTVHSFNTQHNTEQNSSDNLPSYLQTNIIAQMLSTEGAGGHLKLCIQNMHLVKTVQMIHSPTQCVTQKKKEFNIAVNIHPT